MRPVAYHLLDANPRGPARPRPRIDPLALLVVTGVLSLLALVLR